MKRVSDGEILSQELKTGKQLNNQCNALMLQCVIASMC
jgi:hypothetical protein